MHSHVPLLSSDQNFVQFQFIGFTLLFIYCMGFMISIGKKWTSLHKLTVFGFHTP